MPFPVQSNPASFRDPSGYVFTHNQKVFRVISPAGSGDFELLINSGLYQKLSEAGMLVKHQAASLSSFPSLSPSSYAVIQPEEIPFISYPYEWCFSQLKRAALLTLRIQRMALAHGMGLKDASAFNVQFRGTEPVFIDTLSFEKYKEGTPWAAYRQFCEHFLAPLALVAKKHTGLSRLSQLFMDGIPLELANSLMPARSLANSALFTHLHLHSKFQQSHAGGAKKSTASLLLPKKKLLSILDHLEDGIEGLSLKSGKSTWNNYGETHNYSPAGKEAKSRIIAGWLTRIRPSFTWDLGCNTGEFSLTAASCSENVVAMDSDYNCVESLYTIASKRKLKLLPLVIDLANPTPSIGWNASERKTIPERGQADVLLALALIHHLRIGNNTPFDLISDLMSRWGNHAIIEFVPKEDSQVQHMLSGREDIYPDMTMDSFMKAFENNFTLEEKSSVPDSSRVLCLFKKKKS